MCFSLRSPTSVASLLVVLVAGLGTAGCLLPSLEGSGGQYGASDSANGGEDAGGEENGEDGEETSEDTGGGEPDGGSVDAPPFSEVKTILDGSCAGCHSESTGANTALSFPNPEPDNSQYKDILIPDFVKAGQPGDSPLYQRTKGNGGAEMPESAGGNWSGDPAESEETLRLWIEGGAEIPTN